MSLSSGFRTQLRSQLQCFWQARCWWMRSPMICQPVRQKARYRRPAPSATIQHIIRQQRLSSKAWAKEVDKMTKWGALVDPADRNAFIEYLSLNFPWINPEPAERIGQARKK